MTLSNTLKGTGLFMSAVSTSKRQDACRTDWDLYSHDNLLTALFSRPFSHDPFLTLFFLQVTSKNGGAIATFLFTHMEGLLHALDWLIAGLAKTPPSGKCC